MHFSIDSMARLSMPWRGPATHPLFFPSSGLSTKGRSPSFRIEFDPWASSYATTSPIEHQQRDSTSHPPPLHLQKYPHPPRSPLPSPAHAREPDRKYSTPPSGEPHLTVLARRAPSSLFPFPNTTTIPSCRPPPTPTHLQSINSPSPPPPHHPTRSGLARTAIPLPAPSLTAELLSHPPPPAPSPPLAPRRHLPD